MNVELVLVIAVSAAEPSLFAELERLDRALVAAEVRLQAIETERAALVVEVAGRTAELATAEVRRNEALVDFRRRLRALARLPLGARALLLGGARSFADYLATERVLRWIAVHDRKLHERYREESRRLATLTEELTAREARLDALAVQARAERDAIGRTRQERLSLVAGLLHDRDRAARAADEQRLTRNATATLLKKLVPQGPVRASFAANRGRLPWPAAGRVGVGFGEALDATLGTTVAHPGIDLLAGAGAPVQAIAPGAVVFADWLKGYGQVVIIDHGDEYHSLYAHLGSIRVRAGDPVVAGTSVGIVGDTGAMAGARLYFEIRRAGVPEDPLAWLRP